MTLTARIRAELGPPLHDLRRMGPDVLIPQMFGMRRLGPRTSAYLHSYFLLIVLIGAMPCRRNWKD